MKEVSRARLRPDQIFFLSLLAVMTSGTTFLMHRSRQITPGDDGLYSVGTSVLLAEVLKLTISTVAIYRSEAESWFGSPRYTLIPKTIVEYDNRDVEKVDLNDRGSDYNSLEEEGREYSPVASAVESKWQEVANEVLTPGCWKMVLPAILYVIQNTLQLYAVETVPPILYQALTQLKILAATVLSLWLLKRTFSLGQWLSLVVLLAGVVLVSISKMETIAAQAASNLLVEEVDQDRSTILALSHSKMLVQLTGIIGVILACTSGSAAAVYVELKVKSDASISLWIRNAQLALFSLAPAFAGVLYEAYVQGEWAPMRNFGFWAWLTVLMRLSSGFLVALVLKYTDSILKGFATSLAIVLTLVIEIVLLGKSYNSSFLLGTFLVVASTMSYSRL